MTVVARARTCRRRSRVPRTSRARSRCRPPRSSERRTRTLRSASAATATTEASRSRTTSRRRRRHPTTTTCISRSIRISRAPRAPASRRLTSGPVTHSWPDAASFAAQKGASNKNAPLRVGSSGNGGSVTQSNDVSSEAKAKNDNDTHQDADQHLSGRGSCGCESIGIQALAQKAESTQGALALSGAVQDFGRSKCGCQSGGNSNDPLRVHSSGDDGNVAQYNTVSSDAKAKNDNDLDQHGRQTLSGGSGIGIQALGQEAYNRQAGAAFSGALQLGAKNHNSPLRVHSSGNEGSVRQDNSASSDADAKNRNRTRQDGSQTLHGHGCGCASPIAVQALGQSAWNGQDGLGLSGGGAAGAEERRRRQLQVQRRRRRPARTTPRRRLGLGHAEPRPGGSARAARSRVSTKSTGPGRPGPVDLRTAIDTAIDIVCRGSKVEVRPCDGGVRRDRSRGTIDSADP